ncbi:hypothetical protein ACFSHT_30005 [Paraburkholderia silviterrae]|uniref:Uncharacterized protein n=1 Tax=Paraburkholderia silviterrae TaxID=2528715 RepID=A0A4R5MAV0_9BURK|nr:hypothetical protein [Paraburkholderia silviterrae]TDG23833.1 hypothetical protein EYW47_14060 [Paraburkholderia silviterrae]
MVTKTVRRAFSGLTSAFTPMHKANQRAAHTLKSAQQHADEAWKRMTQREGIVSRRKNSKS